MNIQKMKLNFLNINYDNSKNNQFSVHWFNFENKKKRVKHSMSSAKNLHRLPVCKNLISPKSFTVISTVYVSFKIQFFTLSASPCRQQPLAWELWNNSVLATTATSKNHLHKQTACLPCTLCATLLSLFLSLLIPPRPTTFSIPFLYAHKLTCVHDNICGICLHVKILAKFSYKRLWTIL